MAKIQQRTSHILSPMLPGSFATELENRVAEMNNLLALRGVHSNDALAVCLQGIRRGAREMGATFEPTTQPFTAAETAAMPKTKNQPKNQPAATTAAPASKPAPTAAAGKKARVITEDQITKLQVAGTVSEVAPYGCDAEGRPLAPYGIKNDGVPMKRRGRVKESAPAPVAAAPASKPAVSGDLTFDVSDIAGVSDDTETVEASAEETVEAEPEASPDVSAEDIEEMLAGL